MSPGFLDLRGLNGPGFVKAILGNVNDKMRWFNHGPDAGQTTVPPLFVGVPSLSLFINNHLF